MGLMKRWARYAATGVFVLMLACFAGASARAEQGSGVDVILLMDASAMTVLGGLGEEEPWLACPCLNPEHFYLKPAAADAQQLAAGVTFPDAAPLPKGQTARAGELCVYDEMLGAWVALSLAQEYRFCHSFLSEPEARGWQPWQYHFMRDGSCLLYTSPSPRDRG